MSRIDPATSPGVHVRGACDESVNVYPRPRGSTGPAAVSVDSIVMHRAGVMARQLRRDHRLRSLDDADLVAACYEEFGRDMTNKKWERVIPKGFVDGFFVRSRRIIVLPGDYFQIVWRAILCRTRTRLLESLGWHCRRVAGPKGSRPRQWDPPPSLLDFGHGMAPHTDLRDDER